MASSALQTPKNEEPTSEKLQRDFTGNLISPQAAGFSCTSITTKNIGSQTLQLDLVANTPGAILSGNAKKELVIVGSTLNIQILK